MKKPRLKLLVGGWHLLKQLMAFGNPTAGGFETMERAITEVELLNRSLRKELGIELAVSAHFWHELAIMATTNKIGYSAQWNNPRCIELLHWIRGVKEGRFARIGRVVVPGFGLPGSDDGMFINPDPERRQLAHDMMVYAFGTSDEIITQNVGEGHSIHWTGPDGVRWKRLVQGNDVLLGHRLNPKLPEWRMIVDGAAGGIISARDAGYTKTKLLFECKSGGDPCYLDAFTDTALEIRGIREINRLVGANVVEWQGEFCHSRGGGQKFVQAMRQVIRASVFGGRIHLNSGGLAAVKFAKLLAKRGGTPASKLPQYVDNDFLPGEGVKEWVDDQKATIRLGAQWSAQTGRPFEIEFDARFSRYPDTIARLEKSTRWVVGVFNEEAKRLAA